MQHKKKEMEVKIDAEIQQALATHCLLAARAMHLADSLLCAAKQREV